MEERWRTSDDLDMYVIRSPSAKRQDLQGIIRPSLLFIHGSFHAAWCYQENFMGYFNDLGHDCYAVSLRGTNDTGITLRRNGNKVRIEEHVADMISVVDRIYSESIASGQPKPVVVAHSFGGLILMKLLELPSIREKLSGCVFLCSIPPSGNVAMTKRFLRRDWLFSLKIVWGFVFRGVTYNRALCRELFFNEFTQEEQLMRYMDNFRRDSVVVTDFSALASSLPSLSADTNGRASWLSESKQDRALPWRVVVGAGRDRIVDMEGVEETAAFLGAVSGTGEERKEGALWLSEHCHEVMLASNWRLAADLIAKQL